MTAGSLSPAKRTQVQRVRAFLERGWTCGSRFLDPPDAGAPIPRYAARIAELRTQGYIIDRRRCAHPWHAHSSAQFEWRIVARPGDPTPLLFGGDA